MANTEKIKDILNESAEIKKKMSEDTKTIESIIMHCTESIKRGGKIVFCGNGGSAADAQHLSTELIHQFEIKRRRVLAALALTTNTSTITAIGNDWGFDEIFSRQVEGIVDEKDVLIGLSTSGNSKNIIKAVLQAKENGAKAISFTGGDGGELKQISDISLVVPSNNTARIQEAHITIGHIICKFIEKAFDR